MGKYDPDALAQALRNAKGTTVFYPTKYQTSTRARVVPANTATTARTRVRTFLQNNANAWQSTATEDQRAAWRRAAGNAPPSFTATPRGPISGWQLFHRVNLTLQNLSVSIALDPPATQAPDPPSNLSIPTLDASTQALKIDFDGASSSDTALVIYATDQMSSTWHPRNGYWRQIAIADAGDSRPIDVSSAWTSKFGTLEGGNRVGFAVAEANKIDGHLGPKLKASKIATGSATPAMALAYTAVTPPPALSTLTWRNQGSASAVQQSDSSITIQNVAAQPPAGLEESIASLPITRTLAYSPLLFGTAYPSVDIYLFETASGHIVKLNFQMRTAGGNTQISTEYGATGFTSFTNTLKGYYQVGAFNPPWLRWVVDSSHITAYLSADGRTWLQWFQEALTAHFTTQPDKIGFLIDTSTGNQPAIANVFNWG
jgi:hypothetical protein